MKLPNLNEEKKLWRKGYKRVIGLDEAGRGALVGPVVAAAVLINSKFKMQNAKLQYKIQNLRDSKKLIPRKREEFYKILTKAEWLEWGIGKVSEKVIDKINIFEATKLAMEKAIKNLKTKKEKNEKMKIDFLILDGKMKLDLSISQKSIVKADEKVFSCAAASVIAKVTRDRIMRRCHKKYPQYGFDKHKGYPVKYHLKMLKKYSPCALHRKSFKPIEKLLNC